MAKQTKKNNKVDDKLKEILSLLQEINRDIKEIKSKPSLIDNISKGVVNAGANAVNMANNTAKKISSVAKTSEGGRRRLKTRKRNKLS